MPILQAARSAAGYLWDSGRRLFISEETARPVPPRDVRGALDMVLDAGKDRLADLAGQLRDGEIDSGDWQDQVRDELTSLHLAAKLAAVGGIEQLGDEDVAAVGETLGEQLDYLDGFAAEIESGGVDLDSDGFLARAGSYADAARSETYEGTVLDQQKEAGAGFARRTLDPAADHCEDCLDLAGQGWVPIDELTPIGECLCGSRCRCEVSYRDEAPEGDGAEGEEEDFSLPSPVIADAVLFFDPDQARDESGRWTGGAGGTAAAPSAPHGHGAALAKAFDSNLARTAGLSEEQKAGYGAAAHAVLAAMPETATRRVATNLKAVSWHPDTGNLGDALAKDSPKVRRFLDAGGKVGGAYKCSTKTLYLDGPNPMPTMPQELGGKTDSMQHVYAHEFSHAMDGSDSSLSKHSDWVSAWHAEVNTTPARLSVYAREDPSEGFAEFGRLVYASGVDRTVIEHHFPACSAYWKRAGIMG